MTIYLPDLPYEMDALAPYISKETLEYHYGKHHKTYVDNLNKLLSNNNELSDSSLEEIILKSDGKIFNNAAQAYNHNFYWNCLSPNGGGVPKGELLQAIEKYFQDFNSFKEQFSASSIGLFGSGWTWLVQDKEGVLSILNTSNADTPILVNKKPILVCDIWEHAYYIDYRNARPKYIESFWQLVNWDFVAQKLG